MIICFVCLDLQIQRPIANLYAFKQQVVQDFNIKQKIQRTQQNSSSTNLKAHNKIPQNNIQQNSKSIFNEKILNFQMMIPDEQKKLQTISGMQYFSVPIKTMIEKSKIQRMYHNSSYEKNVLQLSKEKHIRGILRTQLIHSINFNGQIDVQLSPFDISEDKKRQALELILQDEEKQYQAKYHISQYEDQQLRFCIVVPSYNNAQSQLYLRNLDSLFMQDYQNYHIVYIDDNSPDRTGQYVKKYIRDKKIPDQKIKVIVNLENKKAMENIYKSVHEHCPDGQIVALVDGDDSLIGRKVLKLFNAIYKKQKSLFVYSNFLKIQKNSRSTFGAGNTLAVQMFNKNYLRKNPSLVAQHLLTFYSDLFKKINKTDLCFPDGTFYTHGYDRAIITPMIQMAFPRIFYIPEMVYQYRNDTGNNDGSQQWLKVSQMVQKKEKYSTLKDIQPL